MTAEQWQKYYDDLSADSKALDRLHHDIYENTTISKVQTAQSKSEMSSIMSKVYYKISGNQIAVKLFEYGLEQKELKRNVNDLKQPDECYWVLSSFLIDLEKFIYNSTYK